MRDSEEKLAVTLNSIGDAVIATDATARVTRLNHVAEQLTGWTEAEAIGRPVGEIFHIINQETRQPSTIPVMATLAHGTIQGLANTSAQAQARASGLGTGGPVGNCKDGASRSRQRAPCRMRRFSTAPIFEYRHRRQGRHPDFQCRRRAHAGLRRRCDEQDHPGRHFRPTGSDRARRALSAELGTPITPGFEALVFKASRGIEDIYELTYIRKDGSRFPAVVSVTALRDAQGNHRLPADRHRQHRAQAGRSRAGAAR
jgi:hypothetical protein